MTRLLRLAPLAAAALAALAVAAVAAGAGGRATFSDPRGDVPDPNVPDVTRVTVSNDEQTVRFAISIANMARLGPDDSVAVMLDTDLNPATGDRSGFEYELIAYPGGIAQLYRAHRERAATRAPAPTATARLSGGVLSLSIARQDLGQTYGFQFYVFSAYAPAGAKALNDLAPAGAALWTYKLALPPELDTIHVESTPQEPVAGLVYGFHSVTLRLVTGDIVRPTKLSCRATIAGKPLPPVRPGACAFRVPAAASGRLLVITPTARYRTAIATFKPYVLRVS